MIASRAYLQQFFIPLTTKTVVSENVSFQSTTKIVPCLAIKIYIVVFTDRMRDLLLCFSVLKKEVLASFF